MRSAFRRIFTYCNEPIKQVYHTLLDDALERYNAKQKRADRCIDDYYERVKEVAALEQIIGKLQNKQADVQAVGQIEVKNVPLSSKLMLEKEDYHTLVTAVKKYVAQVKQESKSEKLLAVAEKNF